MEPLFGHINGDNVIVIDHGGAIDHRVGHAGDDPRGCETTYLVVYADGGSGWYSSCDITIDRPARATDWPRWTP